MRSPRLPGLAAAISAAFALSLACSSTTRPTPSPSSASACGDGYLAAVNGTCPKGTCLEPEASASCCGSQCATCEDKGLIASEDGGTCPEGTCVSTDLTEALSCCDTCPGDDASADASADGGTEASVEASVEAASDASGD